MIPQFGFITDKAIQRRLRGRCIEKFHILYHSLIIEGAFKYKRLRWANT